MSEPATRRAFLQRAVVSAGAVLAAKAGFPSTLALEPEFSAAEGGAMRVEAEAFLSRNAVPGMQVAIARNGRLVYNEAFGFADRGSREPLGPSHLFRIASVSKPITSAAVLELVESGRLSLQDRVFSSTLLGRDFPRLPPRPWIDEVRVEHLLTHTSGGWENDDSDPMFQRPSLGHHDLIAWAVSELPLHHPPGEHYAYSNFGYCLLGRILEGITGRPYERHLREHVLLRCGISAMRIAGNTLSERAEGEVVYEGHGEDPYGMNVRRMDSHGGWLARASDLVRFGLHVDGLSTERNILRKETIREMTSGTRANPGYAKGWQVNTVDNWWHLGSLPGTSSLLVRTSTGFVWAALASTRCNGKEGSLDDLLWRMVRKVRAWRA